MATIDPMATKAWCDCLAALLLSGCSAASVDSGAGVGGFGGGDDAAAVSPSSGASQGGETSSGGNPASSSGGAVGGASGRATAGSANGSPVGGSPDAGPVYSDAAVGSLYDSGPPDASGQQVLTLTMDAFVVDPGAEVYKCQQFGNPFGKNVDLVYYEGKMSAGSHHFFLFSMDPSTMRNQTAPLGDCADKGLEFHPFPYLSQQPNWNVGYPEPKMGYPLVSTNGLMMNVHYLNSGSTPVTAQVSIKITVAAPGTVTTHVGTIFLNNTLFSVPANVPMTSPIAETKTASPLSSDYSIFTSWSHMHKTSVKFTASTNGTTFYTETNWDSPQVFVHSPYMQMKGGSSITWTCNYYNPTTQALTFGDSAVTNVMCIYLGQYFPANPTSPDIISVLN